MLVVEVVDKIVEKEEDKWPVLIYGVMFRDIFSNLTRFRPQSKNLQTIHTTLWPRSAPRVTSLMQPLIRSHSLSTTDPATRTAPRPSTYSDAHILRCAIVIQTCIVVGQTHAPFYILWDLHIVRLYHITLHFLKQSPLHTECIAIGHNH